MADRSTDLAHANLLGVFGERDPEARAKAIQETYAENVTFSDPEEVVVGRAAVNAKAQRLLDDAPGFVFAPVGPVRVVQNMTLLAWQFGPEGAAPVVTGLDVCLIENDRITAIYTVLDTPA